MGKKRK